jgi:glycerol-3-phosphate dehydrogenase
MEKVAVVIVGGGATGVGVLRDLSMRGVKAVLLEQRDLAYGTSSRFHGLLHSGGRYAVKDAESARECIEENRILRKVAKYCVEDTEGFFVRLPEDDTAFEQQWVTACAAAGIEAIPLSPQEARRLEPGLSSEALAVYRVPDSAIDGFRLVWQNVASARQYGGQVRTYTEMIGIEQRNSQVVGVQTRNVLTGETSVIACDYIVNAAGSWVGQVAGMAGIEINVKPDRGVLVAFNHRFTSRVINRLRPPSDGDIFVPHGSITILGTTSSAAKQPDDTIPHTTDVINLLEIGKKCFADLPKYRILRVFAGTRPLYSANPEAAGRSASRNFTLLDHSQQGLDGLVTMVGGKLTTYRLMAEKMTDFICARLNVKELCRTASEPLVPVPSAEVSARARRYFPAYGAELAAARLGPNFDRVVERLEANPAKKQLVCECEVVTLAEVEVVSADSTTFTLDDIRRKTRMGMGTCQGAFCAFRGVGTVVADNLERGKTTSELLRTFLQSRWVGIKPALWGNQLREAELMRSIYSSILNIDGVIKNEPE